LEFKKKNKKQNKKKTLTAATKKTYRLDPARQKQYGETARSQAA